MKMKNSSVFKLVIEVGSDPDRLVKLIALGILAKNPSTSISSSSQS